MKMRELTVTAVLLAMMFIGIFTCRNERKENSENVIEKFETITIRDTVRITDTVTVRMPEVRFEKLTGTQEIFLEKVDERITDSDDSLKIRMPVVSKKYEGSEYEAWVSGIEASLDRIKLTRRTERITVDEKTVFREIGEKSNRWSVGITAGIGICGGRAGPFIGIGISYRLF